MVFGLFEGMNKNYSNNKIHLYHTITTVGAQKLPWRLRIHASSIVCLKMNSPGDHVWHCFCFYFSYVSSEDWLWLKELFEA